MAEKHEKRFVKVYTQSGGFTGPRLEILVDRKTGVNYVYASAGYSGGMTVLLNRDGTPVVSSLPVEE